LVTLADALIDTLACDIFEGLFSPLLENFFEAQPSESRAAHPESLGADHANALTMRQSPSASTWMSISCLPDS
jgi:hypothetical protein